LWTILPPRKLNKKIRKEDTLITKADKEKFVSSYTTKTLQKKYKTSLIKTTSENSQKTPQINTKKHHP
jgi:hypothetical protein